MQGVPLDKLPEAHRKLAEVIGIEATMELCKAYGGTPIYIPKVDALVAAHRDQQIRTEYNGYNVAKLARKYNLSARTVQRILEGESLQQIDGQMGLEDFLH